MDFNCKLKNSVLYEERSLPDDYGILKAREALKKAHNIKNEVNSDNCDEYYEFLDELKKIHAKVDSGDLSDFTELKL